MEGPPQKRQRLDCGLMLTPAVVGAVSTRTAPDTGDPLTLSTCSGGVSTCSQTGNCYVTGYLCFKRGTGSVIQRITQTGVVDVLVGDSTGPGGDVDGVGEAARFLKPNGIVISPDGATLYVADVGNNKIRKVDIASRTVSTIAGSSEGNVDGAEQAASFGDLVSLTISPDGKALIVSAQHDDVLAPQYEYSLRKIDVATGAVSTPVRYSTPGINCDPLVAVIPGGKLVACYTDGHDLCVSRPLDLASIDYFNCIDSGCTPVGGGLHVTEVTAFEVSPDGATLYVGMHQRGGTHIVMVDVDTRTVIGTLAGPSNPCNRHQRGTTNYEDRVGEAAEFCYIHDLSFTHKPDNTNVLVCLDRTGNSFPLYRGILREVVVETNAQSGLEIPPSTFSADMACTFGPAAQTLPQGTVNFIVGTGKRRLEHVSKNVLCVRSTYFDTMFRSDIGGEHQGEINVEETSYEAFESVITYLSTDQLQVDTSTQHAFDTMELARTYQLERLGLLCQEAIEKSLDTNNAIPLMEASHRLNHGRLMSQCRRYVQGGRNAGALLAAVPQLQSLPVAKALLIDALGQLNKAAGPKACEACLRKGKGGKSGKGKGSKGKGKGGKGS